MSTTVATYDITTATTFMCQHMITQALCWNTRRLATASISCFGGLRPNNLLFLGRAGAHV